jgi:adenosylhomocysteinase
MNSIVRDMDLWENGERKISWAWEHMPILQRISEEFSQSQCLKGERVVVSIHLEAKTANLAKVLAAGGADVYVTGSNPLSTQDDVAAALAKTGIKVFAWHNATEVEYFEHLNRTLDCKPTIVIDDGGDLVHLLHSTRREMAEEVIGGSEETTTGVLRLRARARDKELSFPMIAVNDAYCKHLFDNRYGTGQSVWTAIMQTTNMVMSGKSVVVAGYGWCGKGVAMRAKGLGAHVIITEVDPVKAIEAVMDGFKVMTMDDAAALGDVFVTVTGCSDVIRGRHFAVMPNGAIMCNAGHFDLEINIPELEGAAQNQFLARKNIMSYKMSNDRTINLLAEGRLVNLAAGDGHPIEIMDMSFALQALAAKYVAENMRGAAAEVYEIPSMLDQKVAEYKLAAWGIQIDKLTKAQTDYLGSCGV